MIRFPIISVLEKLRSPSNFAVRGVLTLKMGRWTASKHLKISPLFTSFWESCRVGPLKPVQNVSERKQKRCCPDEVRGTCVQSFCPKVDELMKRGHFSAKRTRRIISALGPSSGKLLLSSSIHRTKPQMLAPILGVERKKKCTHTYTTGHYETFERRYFSFIYVFATVVSRWFQIGI